MEREYEPSYKSSPITVASHRGTIEPGQASRSALMRKPEHAIASGLIQQKRWHSSAVSGHAAVQMKGDGLGTGDIHEIAAQGISRSAMTLPFLDKIQQSFGSHDVSSIEAHVGGPASQACHDIGALAYATGNHVAFREAPDLHTAAHEAAHVVQQRAGVHLANGVGQQGDEYERHADLVADAVVAGRSAEALLGAMGSRNQSLQSSGQAERAGAPQKKDDIAGDSSCPKCGSGNCSCAKPSASNMQQVALQRRHGAQLLQREPDDGGSNAGSGPNASPSASGSATCTITVPTDPDTQIVAGAVFAEADPKTTGNTEREEIAGVFYNRVEHVFQLCNGSICDQLNDKQRKAQCTRDTTDFGGTFVDAVRKGSVAFGNKRWNLVMSGTTMKPATALCKLPQSEINAVIAAIDAATTIMGAGANDDAVAFNKGGPPSARMEPLTTIGKHNFHHFKDGRECG